MDDSLSQPSMNSEVSDRADRFESEWKSGAKPAIDQWIDGLDEPFRSSLLRRLIALEATLLRADGHEAIQESYLRRFPSDRTVVEEVFRADISTIEENRSEHDSVREESERSSDPGATDPVGETTLAEGGRPGKDSEKRPEKDPGKVDLNLADFEINERLGEGGMGTVYLARQKSLNRIVAIKMIRSDRLEDSGQSRAAILKRFQREAEAAALLQHDQIVSVFGVGEDRGVHFIVMRYVDGTRLDKLVRGEKFDALRCARYAMQVANALAHAHQNSIIHRDIKPQNIIVDRRLDRPMVTDFGLARFDRLGDEQLTHHNTLLGTPNYMAPEQITGPSNASAASDTYSLGATLYHILTGRPPFVSDDLKKLLGMVAFDPPRPPRQINQEVPRDLEAICLKCLEKDVGTRYATAKALEEDLQRYVNGQPVLAKPLTIGRRISMWCIRNPRVASLTLAVLLVSVFGVVVSQHFAERAAFFLNELELTDKDLIRETELAKQRLEEKRTAVGQAVLDRLRADRASQKARLVEAAAEEQSREAERVVVKAAHEVAQSQSSITIAQGKLTDAESYMRVAKKASEKARGDMLAAFNQRDAAKRQAGQASDQLEAVNKEIVSKEQALADATAKVSQLSAQIEDAVRRRDRAILAEQHALEQTKLAERRMHGAQLSRVAAIRQSDPALALRMLNDPQRFPPQMRNFTWRWLMRLVDRTELILSPHPDPRIYFRWSPSGEMIASLSGGKVQVWRIEDGQLVGELSTGRERNQKPARTLRWSSDSRFVMVAEDSKVHLLDVRDKRGTQQEVLSIQTLPGTAMQTRFAPGSNRVAIQSPQADIRLVACESGEVVGGFDGPELAVRQIQFANGGDRLAVAFVDGKVHVQDLSTGDVESDVVSSEAVAMMAISDSGRLLATAKKNEVLLTDLKTGKVRHRFEVNFGCKQMWFTSAERYLVLLKPMGFEVWDCVSARSVNSVEDLRTLGESQFFTRRRDSIVGVNRVGSLVAHHLVNGRSRVLRTTPPILAGGVYGYGECCVAADGSFVVARSADDTLEVIDVDLAHRQSAFGHPEKSVGAIRISPDGRKVATAVGSEIRVWRVGDQLAEKRFTEGFRIDQIVAFSGDGQSVITAGSAQSIRVWEIKSQSFRDISGNAMVIVALHDGDGFVSGSSNGSVRLHESGDEASGRLLYRYPIGSAGVASIALSRDETLLASVSVFGKLRIYDLAAKAERRIAALQNELFAGVRFLPGHELVLLSRNSLRRHDSITGRAIRNYDYIADSFTEWNQLDVSEDGEVIVAVDRSGRVATWRSDREEFPIVIDEGKLEAVAVELSPNAQTLATCDRQGLIQTWDPVTGELLATIDQMIGKKATRSSLAFSPGQDLLAVVNVLGKVRLYPAVESTVEIVLKGHHHRIEELLYSRDGTKLVSTDQGRRAIVWDRVTARSSGPFRSGVLSRHSPRVAVNGGYVAMIDDDGRVVVHDVDLGSKITLQFDAATNVTAVALAPDGKRVVMTTSEGLQLWSVEPQKHLKTLRPSDQNVDDIRFIRDGQMVVARKGYRTLYWRPSDGARGANLFRRIHQRNHEPVIFSPMTDEGRWVTVESDHRYQPVVRCWQLGRDSPLSESRLSIGSVAAVALAEDDQTVAIATITGDVVVREIGEGSRLTRLSVTAADFKPDPFDIFARQSISEIAITSKHRLLAVGRVSGTVDVFRIEDSSKVASWKVSDDPIRALCFSPVECELAIGTNSGDLVIQNCELNMTR